MKTRDIWGPELSSRDGEEGWVQGLFRRLKQQYLGEGWQVDRGHKKEESIRDGQIVVSEGLGRKISCKSNTYWEQSASFCYIINDT